MSKSEHIIEADQNAEVAPFIAATLLRINQGKLRITSEKQQEIIIVLYAGLEGADLSRKNEIVANTSLTAIDYFSDIFATEFFLDRSRRITADQIRDIWQKTMAALALPSPTDEGVKTIATMRHDFWNGTRISELQGKMKQEFYELTNGKNYQSGFPSFV